MTMKEQPLTITRNDDPAPLQIASTATGKKALQDTYLALNTLHESDGRGTLTVGYAQTLVSLLQSSYLPALAKCIPGLAESIKEQEDQRHARMRQLNDENRELRAQLGQKVTNEDLRERVNNLEKQLREWWDKDGFGYVSEFHVGPFGIKATLSLGLSVMFRTDDKEALQRLLDTFEFDNDGATVSRDSHLLDTRGNQVALLKLINSKFPSALISKLDTVRLENSQVRATERRFHLRALDVYIYNLDDFSNE